MSDFYSYDFMKNFRHRLQSSDDIWVRELKQSPQEKKLIQLLLSKTAFNKKNK